LGSSLITAVKQIFRNEEWNYNFAIVIIEVLKRTFSIALLIYVFVSAIIFPYVRWYADNPDTFQYLAIASKYISGDWSHAVNGYWSPMISWLLTIPLLIFNDDLLAFKILQFVIGGFALLQWNNLLTKTSLRNNLKSVLLFVSIPFFVDYALLNATPDLLFMGLLFLLINHFLDGDLFTDKKQAIKIGITGACLYFTKAFGFPFFIAISLVIVYFERRTLSGKSSWKNISKLYGIFFFLSLFWIIPLSIHYNHLTISETPQFNMSREAAPLPGRSEDLPILGKGLNVPMPKSISAWEHPGEYVSKETITLFNSPAEYFQVVKRNLLAIYYFDFRHQAGTAFLVLLILFLIRKGIKELMKEKWLMILLLFIFLFYVGYSLILVHARYTWINNLLMLLLSVYFIQSVFDQKVLRYISAFLLIAVLLLGAKRPVKEILFNSDSDYPPYWFFQAAKHPFITLWIFYRQDYQLNKLIEDLHQKKIISKNIASLKERNMERDSYTSALRIAQDENCLYYGQVDDELNFQQQQDELKKMNVDYLITWQNTEWGNVPPVYYNVEARVRVYFLK
jgi:hypothetical protein